MTFLKSNIPWNKGLKMDDEYKAKVKRTSFKKGHIPWNKGKKLPEDMKEKLAPTMFKKGERPHNRAALGSECQIKGGYVKIKIAEPNTWVLKHRYVWETANGKIPHGYNIQFYNHDRHDCRLENLYIIGRREQLLTKNSMIAKYPEELQKLIRLKGVLKRKINEQNKKKK